MKDRMSGLRAVARVVMVNEKGEILLCRSRNGRAWVPPGGTLDPGEDLATAAAREAVEEVGMAVELGALLYLQEFRPAGRQEHVIEVAFRAKPTTGHPQEPALGGRTVRPQGPAERPWQSWQIQDVDGPVRVCRWFAQSEVAALVEPVYPQYLISDFWEATGAEYLGLVRGKD